MVAGLRSEVPVGVGEDEAGAAHGLFVYGILPADAVGPDGLTGVDEGPVHLVSGGRVAAAVARIGLDRRPSRRRDLLSYHAVLDALAESGPVAPVRFGSVLPDAEALVEELLVPQEEGLVQLLERLRGRRQFNLRATYHEDVVLAELVHTDPEIRALRQRTRDLPEDASYPDRVRLGELVARELEARGADDAAMLLDVVLPHAVEYVVRADPGGGQVLDVALLVDEERTAAFERALEELAEAVHERIGLRLVGPVAAYDFVGSL